MNITQNTTGSAIELTSASFTKQPDLLDDVAITTSLPMSLKVNTGFETLDINTDMFPVRAGQIHPNGIISLLGYIIAQNEKLASNRTENRELARAA